MALPKLTTPQYELEVPSTREKIKYRPWLIKEQKILLMAQESEDDKEIEAAFANIISECTFGEIDPYVNPLFDIEYIFLQLRGKSIGQKVKLNLLCPDDEKTRVEHEIDLGDVAVQMPDNHTNVIDITDDISMIMRYPKLSDMSEFTEEGQIKQIFDMVKRCVVEIRDGETTHNKVDISDKELDSKINPIKKIPKIINTINIHKKL